MIGCKLRNPVTSSQSQPQSALTTRHVSVSAIGCLIIWTAVLSGMLVSNSYGTGNQLSDVALNFNAHQDIGRIVFAIGHEMISTIDLLLTQPLNQADRDSDKALTITWKMTDSVIDTIDSHAYYMWPFGTDVAIELVRDLLREYRERNLRKKLTPMDAILLYLDVCDRFCESFRARAALPLFGTQPSQMLLPHSANSYDLFIRGMNKRFGEIALGTYYFRSQLPMNVSLYYNLHYSSRELVLASFKYNPRVHMRYFEIQIMDDEVEEALSLVGKDLEAGGANRTSNAHAAKYLDGVKEELATLLLAKDFLNTTIAAEIRQMSRANYSELHFHLCVASVAFTTVVLTLILVACSFRYIKSSSSLSSSSSEAGKLNDKPLPCPPLPAASPSLVTLDAYLANERAMSMIGAMEPMDTRPTGFGLSTTATGVTYPIMDTPGMHFLPSSLYNRAHCYL